MQYIIVTIYPSSSHNIIINRCNIRLKQWHKGIENCNKGLKTNENNIKGYIRRAICYYKISEFKDAKMDAKKFIKLTKDDVKQLKIGNEWLNKIINAEKKELIKQKEIYGNIFNKTDKNGNKFSLYDDKKSKIKNNNKISWIKWMCNPIINICKYIPNKCVHVFNECTKYCRKPKHKLE